MKSDGYLKVVLTLIAVELGWIALTLTGEPVAAQAGQAAPTRVVITGVEDDRPLRVIFPMPLEVRSIGTVRVEPGDKPLKVDVVPYTPSLRPGE
jgi:hypothetical protein